MANKMSGQTLIENLSSLLGQQLPSDRLANAILSDYLFQAYYHQHRSRSSAHRHAERAEQERQGKRMIAAPSLVRQSRKSTTGWDVSGRSIHEVQQWCIIITLPLVGMLLLLVCLLLQGVFAEIGPWVLFVGVKLITKKLEQQPSC
jgi:hypothetical protein